MTRLVCVLLISLGVTASAVAQQSDTSRPAASAAVAAAASHGQAQAAGAESASSAVSASELSALGPAESSAPAVGQIHRIRDLLTQKFGLARAKAEQISSAVMTAASKYSLPPALVLAVIAIESRFQEHARGQHGATGLMQVVPAAHRGLVKNLDLTEPATNIEAGSAILHGYLESARGDVTAALRSYGGSSAYARKVSLRAKDFETGGAASDAHGASPAISTMTEQ
jgi:soluble lytic murein transglycosylase-like protein